MDGVKGLVFPAPVIKETTLSPLCILGTQWPFMYAVISGVSLLFH